MPSSNFRGHGLIEMMLVITLGLALCGTLMQLLSIIYRDSIQIQQRQLLYHEAGIADNWLQRELTQMRIISCNSSSHAVTNFSARPLATPNGIKIFLSNDPTLKNFLPATLIKKILVNSIIIVIESRATPEAAATLIQSNHLMSKENLDINTENLLLLSDCQQTWLIQPSRIYHHNHMTDIYLSQPFKADDSTLSAARWQQVFWFVMKDNQGAMGLYRLQKPEEKSPVEIISHVRSFTAQVIMQQDVSRWYWQNINPTINWQNIAALRLTLTLNNKQQTIKWPISIGLIT